MKRFETWWNFHSQCDNVPYFVKLDPSTNKNKQSVVQNTLNGCTQPRVKTRVVKTVLMT